MRGDRKKRVAEQIQQIAAEFFKENASRTALLTVTRATVSPDFKNTTIYFTVLPESKETAALNFAKRRGSDLRKYAKEQLSLRNIPFFDFKIDKGEKNFYKVVEDLSME